MFFFFWGGGGKPGVNKVHYGLCENDESCERTPIRYVILHSGDRRGAARLHFVTEIAPKSPFLCVNGCPVRCGLRANTKAIRYGLNIASDGSCKGSFVTKGSSSIVREIEDYVLFVFLYKVGKPGCSSANLVDPNSQVLNVTNHLNCNSL